MLTDPFYDPTPAYSPNHTGIIEIIPEIGTDAVALLKMMMDILQTADWELVDADPSTVEVYSIAQMMPTITVPTVPVTPTLDSGACTRSLNPRAIIAHFDGMDYIAYNPYTTIAPECSDRIFFAAGTTVEESAESLAAKISGTSSYTVSFTGVTEDPNIPTYGWHLNFHVSSKAPAWENDYKPIFLGGGGGGYTTKGFYTLRSPITDEGGFLDAKLQSHAMNTFGINPNAELGRLTPFITVRANGGAEAGKEYRQAVWPSGPYWMCASQYQFAIWCDRSGRTGSALVASLPKPDPGHPAGANTPIAYGSESQSWYGVTADTRQVTRQLHWDVSFATGHGNTIKDMGWRTQESSGTYWRNPTLLHRGLRSVPLKTVNSMPLVTSAYAMVSNEPNLRNNEVQIGGRLWDMIVASDVALNTGLIDQEGVALYDNYHWQKLATATISGDLTSSLWVKMEMGGG